jgi:predicted Zn-dependent protease
VTARVLVGAVALVALAWLGVMERDLVLQERGAGALRPGSSAADLARAETDLERARLLNPDPAPDVNLALLHRARGEPARALAAIEAVVRREPDNLMAWATLAVLARGEDHAAVARADAARLRLDPLNARRSR